MRFCKKKRKLWLKLIFWISYDSKTVYLVLDIHVVSKETKNKPETFGVRKREKFFPIENISDILSSSLWAKKLWWRNNKKGIIWIILQCNFSQYKINLLFFWQHTWGKSHKSIQIKPYTYGTNAPSFFCL